MPVSWSAAPRVDWRRDGLDREAHLVEFRVKNTHVVERVINSVYDTFRATDDEFLLIFPDGQDIAFIDDVLSGGHSAELGSAFKNTWQALHTSLGFRSR